MRKMPIPAGRSASWCLFRPAAQPTSIARLIGQKASEAAGQPFIIDNRGGAAGNIGSDSVAKSPGDGYTILQTVSALSFSPALYTKLPFDPVKDLTAVTQLTASPLLIVANAKTGISTLKDLIDRAKAKPGALNFGSGGVGNPQHLTMEMLKAAAGIDMVHVPFKGDAPLLQQPDRGRHRDCLHAAVDGAAAYSGRHAARARGDQRDAKFGAFPMCRLSPRRFPALSRRSWQGWFAPASTPRDIVMKLNGYARSALQTPEVLAALKTFGSEPVGNSPEEFGASFKAEVERFTKIVNDLKLPPQD